MKDLLDKLSSYNIFNYLFPGILFSVIAQKIASIPLMHDDIIVSAFLCYFYGLIISRVGSLIFEPLLKWLGIVKISSYDDYVKASIVDPTIGVLSEQKNLYRTLISLMSILLAAFVLNATHDYFDHSWITYAYIAIIVLIIIFILSFKKQSEYINKRITVHISESNQNNTISTGNDDGTDNS